MSSVVNTTGATFSVGGRVFPAEVPVNVSGVFLAKHSRRLEELLQDAPALTLAPDPASDSSTSSSDRAAVFRAAVAGLAEDDEDAWTRDGRPDVGALNAVLPEDTPHFSARERDEEWARMRAEESE